MEVDPLRKGGVEIQMTDLMCCHDCGSLNIGPVELSGQGWLRDLRLIDGWEERGKPFEYLLWRTDWPNQFSGTELDEAVESFASVQEKTLKGYTNLVAAFKTHIRKGYHKPQSERTTAAQRNTSRASGGRY